eukprot:CAMPEP_0181186398 /NCGR_PEP_ID=MMETSP1096-20121128/10012_1 /TAXON_ID=156174 ORGANISM="Chrysochromulina ericina, Strain CCMP281" /NCGR_SAMPLE_ID=MMETSP1096 /ASSEMBLY_ACC=CAM_ASM_000453 /LENGTH=78 /DNA_ID=CAMNT_0023275291 /DNA_START=826 /DNA_END=1062 /DNA_ORIENTATION=+
MRANVAIPMGPAVRTRFTATGFIARSSSEAKKRAKNFTVMPEPKKLSASEVATSSGMCFALTVQQKLSAHSPGKSTFE